VSGYAEPVRSPPKARPKPKFQTYVNGKAKEDWRNPSAEALARDALIKAQRAAGECIDPKPPQGPV
jgi:hypothetical protein